MTFWSGFQLADWHGPFTTLMDVPMHFPAASTSGSRTLTELFAASVARFPDHPAVSDSGQSLTYRDLDQRSNDLARNLRERGVGVEVRVGVYLDRSVDVFVAIL